MEGALYISCCPVSVICVCPLGPWGLKIHCSIIERALVAAALRFAGGSEGVQGEGRLAIRISNEPSAHPTVRAFGFPAFPRGHAYFAAWSCAL